MGWLSSLFIIFIVFTNLCGKGDCSNNGNATSSTSRDLSEKATRKSYYNGFLRRFAFSPGTFLLFEPEITIPAWRDYVSGASYHPRKFQEHFSFCDGDTESSSAAFARDDLDGGGDKEEDIAAVKNAAIQISSLFYVYFDKLGWTHEDSIYNTPHQVASYIQEYLVNPALHIFGVPPPSTVVSKKHGNAKSGLSPEHSSNKKRSRLLSDVHRLQLFHKVETLLEETGAENGRSCLLRAICELHEVPFDTGRYGIFGEVLALLLSASSAGTGDDRGKFSSEPTNECMNIYAKAEKYGKARDCTRYTKYCKHSVFNWHWKMGTIGAK